MDCSLLTISNPIILKSGCIDEIHLVSNARKQNIHIQMLSLYLQKLWEVQRTWTHKYFNEKHIRTHESKHGKQPFLGIAYNRTKTECSNNLYSKKQAYRETSIQIQHEYDNKSLFFRSKTWTWEGNLKLMNLCIICLKKLFDVFH